MTAYTEPPAPPKCEGTDPAMFDEQIFYDYVLTICDECPVRLWCLQWVDPAKNFYDGVVGGHAWADGKPLPQYRSGRDPILQTYLGQRRLLHKITTIDQVAIEAFLVGKLAWNRLTKAERIEAVRIMHRQQTPVELAADLTHLPLDQVQSIYNQQNTTIVKGTTN